VVVLVVLLVRGADVLHLVDGAALGTALDGALARHLGGRVRQRLVSGGRGEGRRTRGRTVSQMVTWESAGEPVQPAYCSSPKDLTRIGSSRVPVTSVLAHFGRSRRPFLQNIMVTQSVTMALGCIGGVHTPAASIQRLHIEDIHSIHLAQDLESLQTRALLEVGRDGTWRSSRCEEVRFVLNLYSSISPDPILTPSS